MDKGVGMSQLPAVRERTIGSSGGLIRIAAMPKRPGQHDKGADPEVLPVAESVIAMLVRPIQRHGRFEMGEGGTVIAAQHQKKARLRWPSRSGPDEGCDWATHRKLAACSSAAAIAPPIKVKIQSP